MTSACATENQIKNSVSAFIGDHKMTTEVVTSPSRYRQQTHRGGVLRSPNKRHTTSSILSPPPGACPRIPPFPGVATNGPVIPSSMFYSNVPPPPPLPPHNMQTSVFVTPQYPLCQPTFSFVFQRDPESKGYRLMMSLPVGNRDDGTYGILTCVRPDQEYRFYNFYVNNVTYFNLPSDILPNFTPPTM